MSFLNVIQQQEESGYEKKERGVLFGEVGT